MNAPTDFLELVSDLKTKGEPFAIATVVRTVAATSAKAGAKAIIMGDGRITEGWIGGGCARTAVLKAARDSLDDGTPRLISVQPEDLLEEGGVAAGDVKDGVAFARNMCPSKGSMDIFIEAVRPKPELVIFGSSPVAVALAGLAKPLGFSRTICANQEDHGLFADAELFNDGFEPSLSNAKPYMVISTQGSGDTEALRAALEGNPAYVSFVGSGKKFADLKEKLVSAGMAEASFDILKAPAGLDIKAITPEEIALSILAEIVAHRRSNETYQKQEVERNAPIGSASDAPKGLFAMARNVISRQGTNRPQTDQTNTLNETHPYLLMRCPYC